jgi:hypothetical protein
MIELDDLNVEAAFSYPQDGETSLQLPSDDGTSRCHNRFRSPVEKRDRRE